MWILIILLGVGHPTSIQTIFNSEISCVEASHKVIEAFKTELTVKTVCVRQ